ncbi:MAG TPA: hypothetical protein VHR41_12770 [Gemmatimonadales bacterium]|jgi:hypothetical protein|nr:hypothetical protein [Gemmatimonadales bacterium]
MGKLRYCLPGVALVWLIGLEGCGPKVSSFDVSPLRACPGDTIAIGFKVSGTPSLTVTRRGDSLPDTTTYTIHARRGSKEKYARKEVITLPPGAEKTLSFDVDSVTPDSLIAVDTLSSDVWKPSVTIGSLASKSDPPISVKHGGRTAAVNAGDAPSTAFTGLTVDGPWRLAAPIPSGTPPTRLRILLQLRCQGQGTPS